MAAGGWITSESGRPHVPGIPSSPFHHDVFLMAYVVSRHCGRFARSKYYDLATAGRGLHTRTTSRIALGRGTATQRIDATIPVIVKKRRVVSSRCLGSREIYLLHLYEQFMNCRYEIYGFSYPMIWVSNSRPRLGAKIFVWAVMTGCAQRTL